MKSRGFKTAAVAVLIVISLAASALYEWVGRGSYTFSEAVKFFFVPASDRSLVLSDFEPSGCEISENTVTLLEKGAGLVFDNMNRLVGSVTIDFFEPLEKETYIEVLLNEKRGDEFSVSRAFGIFAKPGEQSVAVDCHGFYAADMRVELGEQKGESFTVESVNADCLGFMAMAKMYTSNERIMLLAFIPVFIGLHFIFGRKKLWDFLYRYRYAVAAAAFLFCVLFKLHGSSVGMWDKYIQPEYTSFSHEPLFGAAQSIRSDEWMVNTTFQLSQFFGEKFSYFNDIVRGVPTDMFFNIGSPVTDIAVLARPFAVGYLFLGAERGLSFWWCGRFIALFMASFEFFMLLTKKRRSMAFAGAVLTALSAAVGWFFSTTITEILIFGQAAVVLAFCAVTQEKFSLRLVSAAALGMCASGYLCCFYPAWMIPFALIFVVVLVLLIAENREKVSFKRRDFICVAVMLGVFCLIGLRVVIKSWDTMQLLLGAEYPGERTDTGGGGLAGLFNYFASAYMPFSSADGATALGYFSFASLFPAIPAAVLIAQFGARKKDGMIWGLSAVVLVLFTYIVFGWPAILAKITLFNNVGAGAASVPLGYCCICLLLRSVSTVRYRRRMNIFAAAVLALGCGALCAAAAATWLAGVVPLWFAIILSVFISAVFFTVVLFSDRSLSRVLVAVLALLCAVGGLGINPLMKGLDCVYDKPVSLAIRQIAEEDPEGRWITVNTDYAQANYLVLNGAKTVNSSSIVPVLAMAQALDEGGENSYCYNRYCHPAVSLTDGPTDFVLNGKDSLGCLINFDDLYKTGAKYIYTEYELASREGITFTKLYGEYGANIYLVEYN